jgi:hypothetical protein
MNSNQTNANTVNTLVNAEGLLKAIFPDENSRPCVRWLRMQQKARTVPYVKWGRLVMFDVAQVRAALEKKNTVLAR